VQPCRDVGDRRAVHGGGEDVAFPLGQRVGAGRQGSGRQGRIDHPFPGQYPADRGGQLLDRARASLRDAGIEPTVRTSGQPLPPTVDALLTWAVREGVTNVIRHSQARTCRIEVGRADSRAYTEIVDDGGGGAGASPGNGLRGLTERMAAVGGEVCAGPAPGGGYRLTVNLPLDPFPRDPSHPRDPSRDHERSGAHSTANPS